jgi:hypothetical protein
MRSWILILLFLSSTLLANEKFILINENIINQKTSEKIEKIGKEVKEKLNISIYLIGKNSLKDIHITQYEKEVAQDLKGSFVLITLANLENKVDIISSEDIKDKIDRNSILNDYIIPLLVNKGKMDDIVRYSAGLLNGYSEVADQLAATKGITLDNSLGYQTQDTMNFLRLIFYGTLILAFFVYLKNKFQNRKDT